MNIYFLCRHLALHGSSNFICRICKDVFINQSLLDEHFIAKHPQKSSYHCDICNEDFISELFLNIHESEHHKEPTPRQSTNPTRDGNFDENDSSKISSMALKILKSHSYYNTIANIRGVSGNKNQFWCPVCFKHFDQKENMRLHFRTDHVLSTGSVYVCEVCESEKPSAEMLCFHLEMHSSNVLSVNRFSTLRACINDREIKSREIIPNMSKSKISSQNHNAFDDEEVLIPSHNVTKRKYKLTQKQKSITKVSKGFKKTTQKQPHPISIRMLENKTASRANLYSKKHSQPITVRKRGNGKLYLDTGAKTCKLNNRNKRLIERKTRQLNKSTYNSNKHALSPKHVETSESDEESSGNSSDENSPQENIDAESKNLAKAYYDDDSNNENTVSANRKVISDGVSSVDAKNTEDDTCEGICCSMCSMTFYHQDELLDHVATHI